MAIIHNACEQEFIDKGYDSDRAYEICRDQEGGDRFDEDRKSYSSEEDEEVNRSSVKNYAKSACRPLTPPSSPKSGGKGKGEGESSTSFFPKGFDNQSCELVTLTQ